MTLKQTPSQTIGPFFAYGLTPGPYGYDFADIAGPVLAGEGVAGQHIRLEGRVLDGEGVPVPDAMIELWQAGADGRYASTTPGRNAAFTGFGRCGTGTDAENRFRFDTVKPGPAGPDIAPFVSLIVFMRGLLSHVYTRVYFADETQANAADPVLRALPPERRGTLIARRQPTGDDGALVYRHDIHMQGEHETVFFDV